MAMRNAAANEVTPGSFPIDNGGFWPTNWSIEGLAMSPVSGQLLRSNHGAENFADLAAILTLACAFTV